MWRASILLALGGIIAKEVARGMLVQTLEGWEGQPITIYAMNETRLLPAKSQRFIEFLRARLSPDE